MTIRPLANPVTPESQSAPSLDIIPQPMRQDIPDGRDFVSRFPDLKIVTPEDFLSQV